MDNLQELEPIEEQFIDTKQLKKLQDFEVFSKTTMISIGDLQLQYESAKGSLLQEYQNKKNIVDVLYKEIVDEFGEGIKVDINDGQISK